MSELLAGVVVGDGRALAAGGVEADAPRGAQRRLSGRRLERDLGGRRRAVGPEGTAARASSLSTLLGRVRERVPVYGSGGFTSYSAEQMERQLAGWVAAGHRRR